MLGLGFAPYTEAGGLMVTSVSEEECIYSATIKVGMLLEAIDGRVVAEASGEALLEELEDGVRPVQLTFRSTVEQALGPQSNPRNMTL